MDTLSYKTVSANKATVDKQWVVVDAEGQVLGRLASLVAMIIRGKHKPSFTPHVDCGDNVIVINAEKVVLTGKKMTDKQYVRHSGHPGGQTIQSPADLMKKFPERIIEKAVRGMLPKNRLGDALFTNLKVVVGPNHKYEAQKPTVIDLNSIK
ncbi:MAG: 50S ribosomal protein L13 [Prolixibacteraceae bacterium]|nr:50S ribosomal protein L13 [Prolixibacteraceae bacterium]